MKIRPTKEQLNDLIFNKNLTYKQISKLYGCGEMAIAYWRRKYNIKPRHSPPQISKELLEHYILKDKLTYKEISKIHNCSYPYIAKLVIQKYKIRPKQIQLKKIISKKTILEELNINKLTITQIAKKYNLKRSSLSDLSARYGIPSQKRVRNQDWININGKQHKHCFRCGKLFLVEEFYTSGPNFYSSYCKNCDSLRKKETRNNKKQKIVNCFKSKCFVCNYNRCIKNLSFHHINPKTKKAEVSDLFNGKNTEKLFSEIKKCILVCSNCHIEIHDNIINLPSLLETRKDEYKSYLKNLDDLLFKQEQSPQKRRILAQPELNLSEPQS